MKMKIVTLGVLLFLGMASHAWAGNIDGHKLVSSMRAYEDRNKSKTDVNMLDAGFYIGFVEGIYDAVSNVLFCPNSGIVAQGSAIATMTVQQAPALVGKYLTAHPEEWNQPAASLVVKALSKSFPCR